MGWTRLQTALALHELGIPCFPVHPRLIDNRKVPSIKGWQVTGGSTDTTQLRTWFADDSYNIGVVPEKAGCLVVDIDDKNGKNGSGVLATLEARHQPLPHTLTVRTPTKGRHLWFRLPPGRSFARGTEVLGEGLDIICRTSFVVVPPSEFPGYGDGPYIVARGMAFADLPELPDWVVELLLAREEPVATTHSALIGAPISIEIVRDMLRTLDPDCDRDQWRNIVAAVHAAPVPEDEEDEARRQLAQEWSRGDLHGGVGPSRYTGPEAVDLVFDTMLPRDPAVWGIHFGTLVTLARAAGYTGPVANVRNPAARMVVGEVSDSEPYSQDDLALLFADQAKGRLVHVERRGWLVNDGSHYRETEIREPWGVARKIARERVRGSLDLKPATVRTLLSNNSINGIVNLASSDRRLAIPMAAFDADPWALNTPGGVVELSTGALRPREAPDLFCKITAVTPGGDCPRWLLFLEEVTGGDVELQRYLQRLIGYSLIGEVKEHVLAFFYGPGGNGKGVFLNTINAILGSYAKTAPADMLTESKTERHPTDLAMLQGSRLVTAQETEEGRAWAEAKIKSLTGGDPITARYMRQDFFTYQPQFTLLVAGNHKPRLRNVDAAMRRRLHMIPFTIKIANPDLNLGEKLREEWSGILRWAIEGCLAWQQTQLAPPSAVLDLTERYFEDQDPIGQWFDESCIKDPSGWTSSMDLLASCNASLDYGQSVSIQVLATRLDGFGCRPERQRVPGIANPQRGFRGVRLVTQIEFRAT